MRLLHLVSEPGPSAQGVVQKVRRTVDAWRRLGHDAACLDLASGRLADMPVQPSVVSGPDHRLGWIAEMHRRGRRVLEVLDRERPDLVYTRELVWAPSIERMFRSHRVVVEINGDTPTELRARSRAAAFYWSMTSRRLLSRASGLVAVTEELGTRFNSNARPMEIVGNTVQVPDEPPPRRPDAGRPMVVMPVGSAAEWHGIDRLSGLARELPEFRFVVVGPGSGPPDGAVEFMPPMAGPKLADLLEEAAVCFGTLALSRKGLREACPLKSRTALAAGVPLVYAYDDPGLEGTESFVHRVPDREGWTPDVVEGIRDFVRAMVHDFSASEDAWRHARRHFDVLSGERRRLDFFMGLPPAIP